MIGAVWGAIAAADTIPLGGLGQLGAVGAVLAIFFWFGYKVYTRETSRADANEAEVKRLNTLIQDRYVPALQSAAEALHESNRILATKRRPDA